MADEMDPADALALVLKERERAKKAVYNMAMAKERAEQERDEWVIKHAGTMSALEMALSEKNTVLRAMGELKDKEVARSQIIDALTKRVDAAEKREKILETVLGRIENELSTAILEEDEFIPLGEVVKDSELSEKHDEILYGAAAVSHDLGTTRPGPSKRDRMIGWFWGWNHRQAFLLEGSIKAVIFSKSMALATLIATPFIAMSVFNALATQGIYIDFIRDLWVNTTWLPDSLKNSLVAWSPVIAVQPFFVLFLFRWAFPRVDRTIAESAEEPNAGESGRQQERPETLGQPGEPATGSTDLPPDALPDKNSYDKVLDELFGKEDDSDS